MGQVERGMISGIFKAGDSRGRGLAIGLTAALILKIAWRSKELVNASNFLG